MRALHTAATGMMAQELNVQVISNNIANMRTTGYKRQRAEFQDLLYEHVAPHRHADVGPGQHPAGRRRSRLRREDRRHAARHDAGLPVADRKGFRRRDPRRRLLQDPDAGWHIRLYPRRFVRDGRAGPHRHRAGQPRAARHHDPPERQRRSPSTSRAKFPSTMPGQTGADRFSARFTLTRFINKAGLQAIGDNLFTETPASGTPQDGVPKSTAWATCSKATSNRPMSKR